MSRPKADTVLLAKEALRFEPMWYVSARREVDYNCELTYPVPVNNPYAQSIEMDGKSYEVTRQQNKAKIELQISEKCHRKIEYSAHIDGLRRDIKPLVLQSYIQRYKYTEVAEVNNEDALIPQVPLVSVLQQATANLHSEAINAHNIIADMLSIDRAYLFFRPVFAFEYIWTTADKKGVIEVDGLTGEVIENGQWFKDKINRVMTREMLFELGGELAGSFIPGAGVAVKAIDLISAQEPKEKINN
ncbi:hypothetical protein [Motilimonas sp. KMU-193]|uniref:hypothetical protein n=1 Tax=Motilimonas sp. KMU-193 TaxID=3388668 RepID=UPI00396B0CB0